MWTAGHICKRCLQLHLSSTPPHPSFSSYPFCPSTTISVTQLHPRGPPLHLPSLHAFRRTRAPLHPAGSTCLAPQHAPPGPFPPPIHPANGAVARAAVAYLDYSWSARQELCLLLQGPHDVLTGQAGLQEMHARARL